MQKNRLREMEYSSVDLVERGAAQDALIKFFKSADGKEVKKTVKNKSQDGYFTRIGKAIAEAIGLTGEESVSPEQEMADITKAWNESCSSIWNDPTLTAVQKQAMFKKSLAEFAQLTSEAIPEWAGVEKAGKRKRLADSKGMEGVEDDLEGEDEDEEENYGTDRQAEGDYSSDNEDDDEKTEIDIELKKKKVCKNTKQTKEEDPMETINVAKMSPEDQAIFAELKKKYAPEQDNARKGTLDPAVAKMHPEVAKALEDVRAENVALKKSMEMKELTDIAKKYECLGKKVDETADKLYVAKQAGGTAYADLIGLMDEMVSMQERSGIFKEFGTSASGGSNELAAAVAEVKKAEPTLTDAQAVVKAYELNPNIPQF